MAHQEIANPGADSERGDCRVLVSARVAGKTLESRDKGARGRGEDKTGHSGMNIHRKGRAALCMHGSRTKRKHTVCCICTQASHVQKNKQKNHLINMQIYKVASIHFIISYYPHQDGASSQLQRHNTAQFTVNYSPLIMRTAQKNASQRRKQRE